MIQQSQWRRQASPIIASIIMQMRDKSEVEVRAALQNAYPFGPRKYHPYKIWLDEIKRQTGKLWPIGHKKAWENSNKRRTAQESKLAEWERIYGKRTEIAADGSR